MGGRYSIGVGRPGVISAEDDDDDDGALEFEALEDDGEASDSFDKVLFNSLIGP